MERYAIVALATVLAFGTTLVADAIRPHTFHGWRLSSMASCCGITS